MEKSVIIINIINILCKVLSAWADIEVCRYHQRQYPIRNVTSCVLELKPSMEEQEHLIMHIVQYLKFRYSDVNNICNENQAY